ncbi:MAG: UDP-N-acetylmuramate dehydrogenase [Myxococcaceae bacterium]|nr:UDP-N-acetylmuramate dehydrogenase [Myxococcaceae bacterium]MBH2006320.1 UDP-N-acetylmuramate dehydrogenase [Myxococcaceae bacterium]
MFEGIDVRENEVLAPYTTFKLGGPADYLAFPKNVAELQRLLDEATTNRIPIHLLGGGSNLLIHDSGLRGLVVSLEKGFSHLELSLEKNEIRVGAGASFPKLTRRCLELGWEVALGWGGVPGSVGGALKMNAGTRLGEIGEVVLSVEVSTLEGMRVLTQEQMGFAYRSTSFPSGTILCEALLRFPGADPLRKQELLEKARLLALQRKATQPKERSAGSMFKNPPGDYAGRLIESCDLKGLKMGGAAVSSVHANFIVNEGKATAFEILRLSEYVRERVEQKFDIKLEYEVRRWGF